MSRIDDLLQADAANAPVALDLLRNFDPATVEVFELAGELFEVFNACAATTFSELDAADDRELVLAAANLGLTREELVAAIASNNAEAEVVRARTLWKAIGARHAKKFLLLLLSRYFRWAVADLLRLRVTPVLGYGRLQAEACGLLRLFVEEPDRAEEWVRASLSEAGGRRFYGQTQAALRTIMTRYRLNAFYERGSGSSQHVRMASVVMGISLTDMGTQLRDQEIDPDDPGNLDLSAERFYEVTGDTDRQEVAAVAQTRPSIIVTTSGMLTGGPVLHYARHLLPDPRHRIVLTGYQDEGAPSRVLVDVAAGRRTVTYQDERGEEVKFDAAMPAKQIGLSAHTDQPGLLEYARKLTPRQIALVHGESQGQQILRQQLLPSCASCG